MNYSEFCGEMHQINEMESYDDRTVKIIEFLRKCKVIFTDNPSICERGKQK